MRGRDAHWEPERETKLKGGRGLKAQCWILGDQEITEGEGKNMPVRNEGEEGKGRGDNQGTTCIWTTASGDPEKKKTSDTSSELGLFTGRGTFGSGWSFGGEVVLLARSTR